MSAQAKHVLVVDDCPAHRAVLEFGLAKAGFRATSAADASEALKLVATCRFDLVISDYMMPGLTGTDLIKQLRSHPNYTATPIILLTAKAAELNTPRISDDLLVLVKRKPCVIDEVVDTVSKCVEIADSVLAAQAQ
jgi:CheY-like chemotaxis protein